METNKGGKKLIIFTNDTENKVFNLSFNIELNCIDIKLIIDELKYQIWENNFELSEMKNKCSILNHFEDDDILDLLLDSIENKKFNLVYSDEYLNLVLINTLVFGKRLKTLN